MPRKGHSSVQVLNKLRQVEVAVARGWQECWAGSPRDRCHRPHLLSGTTVSVVTISVSMLRSKCWQFDGACKAFLARIFSRIPTRNLRECRSR